MCYGDSGIAIFFVSITDDWSLEAGAVLESLITDRALEASRYPLSPLRGGRESGGGRRSRVSHHGPRPRGITLPPYPPSEEGWSLEAGAVLESLITDRALEAMVVGYAEDGTPFVNLYSIQATEVGNGTGPGLGGEGG